MRKPGRGAPILKAIVWGVLVAGPLDLVGDLIDARQDGASAVEELQTIASGPFGASMHGHAAALAGLAVHFAMMTVMAAVLVLAMSRSARLRAHAVATGLLYGFGLYLVMYWIVLPRRWPTLFPELRPADIAAALFLNCICTGLPLALIARRFLGRAIASRR